MRSYLVVALLCAGAPVLSQSTAPAPSHSSPSTNEIIAQEATFWKFYVKGKSAELNQLMLPDFTEISKNILSRADALDEIKQTQQLCSVNPVNINDPQVAILSPEVATIAYSTTIAKTCGHKTVRSATNVTSVWVRQDGRWQMHLHTEFIASEHAFQSQ